MRALLLVLAPATAAAAPIAAAAPAAAQPSGSFASAPTAAPAHGALPRIHRGSGDHKDGEHRRRHRGRGQTVVVAPWVGDLDWDGGRAWEAESYNDWWHERPHRSYPRWLSSNQNCAPERMWWSGGVWRC